VGGLTEPKRLDGMFCIQVFTRHKSELGECEHSSSKSRGALQVKGKAVPVTGRGSP
jgi:hypothetical protein